MADVYFTYRDNIYNDYIGQRVRVNVANRKKKPNKVFIGTLKAFDLHLNVVLADVCRVILFYKEEQAEIINGLMMIRGEHVRCINLEDRNLLLPPWPTKPITSRRSKRAMKSKATKILKKEDEKNDSSNLSTPINPPKPLKLKRTWLTTPATSNPTKAASSQEGPGSSTEQINVSVKQEAPDGDHIPVKVKEEVKESGSEGDSLLKSFNDFLNCDDLKNESSDSSF